MTLFDQLVEYVKKNYPSYAYVLKSGEEIAVDGLIFLPKSDTVLVFRSENGEQEISFDEAIQILVEDAES
mgnify:CR=1 FL=1